jgi:hypothetical protein
VPTTRREFTRTFELSAFVRVYQGGPARPVAASVRTIVRDSADRIVFEKTQPLAAAQFGPGRGADVRVDLPMAEFAPGAYLLSIEAAAGAATARRDSRFQVVR